jgi:hypothetical protein
MIELPFCSSGRAISAGAHEADVVGDLRQRDREHLERPGGLDDAVAGRLRLERVRGRGDLEPCVLMQTRTHARGELRVRVQSGPGGRAAEGHLAEPRQRVAHARGALAYLGRVTAELLAERDRDCVHPVRPTGLDHVVELLRLRLERRGEPVERRQQVVRQLVERSEVHRARKDVVRRLAHVHVVVGVHALAGKAGDHLVGVHVRGGARARLEDVDRKLVVELPRGDPVAGGGDALGLVGVEQPELGVHARGGSLDAAEPARDRRRDRLTRDRKVVHGLLSLASPELLLLGSRHRHESSQAA